MNAWILVGGRLTDTAELRRARSQAPDLVIAADGGIRHSELLGVTPDVWVGDFDSSDAHDPRFSGIPRESVPRDKNFTDAELALSIARKRGASRVTFWGALGGRFDHALALALLGVREAESGLDVTLHSGDESAAPLLPCREIERHSFAGQTLSILALDALGGLCISGARWPLEHVSVPAGSGWTVSNEAAGESVRASVGTGRALLVQQWP